MGIFEAKTWYARLRNLALKIRSLFQQPRRRWVSPQEESPYPAKLAKDLTSYISSISCSYEDLMGVFLGHKPYDVEKMLATVLLICDELSCNYPKLKNTLEQMAKELEAQHPVALWIVSNASKEKRDPWDALKIFTKPMGAISAANLSISEKSKRFKLLSLVYKANIEGSISEDWSTFYAVKCKLLNTILSSDPKTVATTITDKDAERFGNFTIHNYGDTGNGESQKMATKWTLLVHNIQFYCIANDCWKETIFDIAIELINIRNFYSGTAFLKGCLNARLPLGRLAPLMGLLNDDTNYQKYRNEESKASALPYLTFHQFASAYRVDSSFDTFKDYTLPSDRLTTSIEIIIPRHSRSSCHTIREDHIMSIETMPHQWRTLRWSIDQFKKRVLPVLKYFTKTRLPFDSSELDIEDESVDIYGMTTLTMLYGQESGEMGSS